MRLAFVVSNIHIYFQLYVHTIKYLLPLIPVPLLPNFQVDALRTQVSSLESDLRATGSCQQPTAGPASREYESPRITRPEVT